LLLLDDEEIKRAVAHGLGWGRGGRSELIDGELELLQRFAADLDPYVRRSMAIAALRLAAVDAQLGIHLWASIDFTNDPDVAEELFAPLMMADCPLRLDLLSSGERDRLTDQLVKLDDLRSYGVQHFLSRESHVAPDKVIELFRQRVEVAEQLEELASYLPVPHFLDVPLRVREHPESIKLLRALRDWLGSSDNWKRSYFGGQLFAAAAGSIDDGVLALVREMFGSSTSVWVRTAAAILKQAPRSLVLSDVPFVAEAIEAAARLGKDSEEKMAGALWASLVTGARTGVSGQPFPQDVEQMEVCAKIADGLPEGTRAQLFYRSLSESAGRVIARDGDSDRRRDGRDWV